MLSAKGLGGSGIPTFSSQHKYYVPEVEAFGGCWANNRQASSKLQSLVSASTQIAMACLIKGESSI